MAELRWEAVLVEHVRKCAARYTCVGCVGIRELNVNLSVQTLAGLTLASFDYCYCTLSVSLVCFVWRWVAQRPKCRYLQNK